ncbi:22564_t:CDS:1, partial [Gigaspora rosea]
RIVSTKTFDPTLESTILESSRLYDQAIYVSLNLIQEKDNQRVPNPETTICLTKGNRMFQVTILE